MPAAPRDWCDPFLEQAREDLAAAWLVPPDKCPSTFCMLIQMVFEKLAKAAYARSGLYVPRTHRVASHLFLLLLRHPSSGILRAGANVKAFVMQLEAAHPAVAGKQTPPWPQLEYPWEDTQAGRVCCSARDLPLIHRVTDPHDRIALDCLRFASAIEKQLHTIVP